MPFPYDLGHSLVNAPEHTPLRIRHIAFELIRHRCAEYGLHEGSEITCVSRTDRSVVLEFKAQERIALDSDLGTFIEVEPTC